MKSAPPDPPFTHPQKTFRQYILSGEIPIFALCQRRPFYGEFRPWLDRGLLKLCGRLQKSPLEKRLFFLNRLQEYGFAVEPKCRLKHLHSNDHNAFPYEPLADGEFRLLELHPGQPGDAIHISFVTASIHAPAHDYQALSYTWGRAACRTTQAVYACGQRIAVSCNIRTALESLRSAHATRHLWIDVLCINQACMPERSAQVLLMEHIYRNASGVTVWLGPGTDTTDGAFRMMRAILDWDASHDSNSIDLADFPAGEFLHGTSASGMESLLSAGRGRFVQRSGLPVVSNKAWGHLQRILWHPWFYRIWVIQEVALAREVQVRCGDGAIPWDDLVRVARFMDAHFQNPSPMRMIYLWPHVQVHSSFSAAPVLYLGRVIDTVKRDGGHAASLTELLALSLGSAATLPVDKIYGILGLTPAADRVTPAYDAAVDHVFISVFKQLVASSLDVLSQASTPRWIRMEGLPSWVPDWSQPIDIEPLLRPLSGVRARSCGATTPRVSFLDDRTFVAQGLVVDTIVTVGPAYMRDFTMLRTMRTNVGAAVFSLGLKVPVFPTVLPVWEHLAGTVAKHPTGAAIGDVFSRTLIADVDISGDAEGQDLSCLQVYTALRDGLLGGAVDKWPKELQRAQTEYCNTMESKAHGRRFFVTARGYMGLGPMTLEVGDQVVVLCGGRTPYVLHPLPGDADGQRFTFEGEAYMYGLMDGEAFENDPPLRDFAMV